MKKSLLFVSLFLTVFYSTAQKTQDDYFAKAQNTINLIGENHYFIDTSVQFALIRNCLSIGKKVTIYVEAEYSANYIFDSIYKTKNLELLRTFFSGRIFETQTIMFNFIKKNNCWDKVKIVCFDVPDNRVGPIMALAPFIFDNKFSRFTEAKKGRAYSFPKLISKTKLKKIYMEFEHNLVKNMSEYKAKYGEAKYEKYYLNALGGVYYCSIPKGKFYSNLRDTFMYQCLKRDGGLNSDGIAICILGALHVHKTNTVQAGFQDSSTVYVKNLFYYLKNDPTLNNKISVFKYIHPENKEFNYLNDIKHAEATSILTKCESNPCFFTKQTIQSIDPKLGEKADYFILEGVSH